MVFHKSIERAGRWFVFIAPALIILLALSVYTCSISFDFVNYDDSYYTQESPFLSLPVSQAIWAVFCQSLNGDYYPITQISFVIDHSLSGMNPAGFHTSNVAFHCMNALMVYFLLLYLTGNPAGAFLGASLWAVHPVMAEPVCWISARKDLLSAAFVLMGMNIFVRKGERSLFFCVLLYFLALCSKYSSVVFPGLIGLLWWYGPKQSLKKKIVWVSAFFLLGLVFTGVTFWTQSKVNVGLNTGLRPFFMRILDMGIVFWRYIMNLLIPMGLNPRYPNCEHLLSLKTLLALLFVLLFIISSFWLGYRRKPVGMGLLIFLISMIPYSQIIPHSIYMADRYLYLAMVGPALLIAQAYQWIGNRWKWVFIPAVFILIPCAVASFLQAGIWRDSVSLWKHSIAIEPQSRFPY